jgi:NAD-dependent SIR2 family protein deacetylase
LPLYAKKIKATLIEVNPENTPLVTKWIFSIRKTTVDALPKMVSIFESLN